jgi:2-oxo-4-hydroxy-4-carboxy--5-ureidoimidazoline (OHCU) decarboxylase
MELNKMEREEVIYLKELTRIFETTFNQLKKAYNSKNIEEFNSFKKALINVQEKISKASR